MRLKHYILEPGTLDEASYSGNIGFEELANFYKVASNEQKREMDKILEREDWNAFKELIRKVVGTKLK